MDSDDTISCQNGQRFQKLLGTHIPPSVMGMVMQVHCPTEEKGTIVSVDHIKVFRNVPALRFTGRIHEQVLGSIRRLGGEVWRTELFVSHSGSDLSAPGRILKQERDFRLLKLELNDEPDSTFALFNLGMTLIDMGRAEEALNPLARSLQMAGPAESHVRKAYALLVQAYGDLNRTESALWTCQRGLELFPDDPELIFRHGVLLQKVGRLTESLISFERVLALPQQNHFSSLDIGILGVKAWQNVAMISESLGHQKKAEEAWRRAIMCDPQSVVSWWGFLGLGEFAVDEGLENCLARLGTNSPDEMEVHLLVRAMTDIRRNQHRSALQLLDSHVRSPTCGLRFVEVACRLAFHSPQLTTAHEWLAILNAKQPENPSTLHNLAAVQLKLGLFGEACRNAMKSCELRPNYQPTLALLKASKAHS
jgi:tetratricopeptide (TPR) repeat protein